MERLQAASNDIVVDAGDILWLISQICDMVANCFHGHLIT